MSERIQVPQSIFAIIMLVLVIGSASTMFIADAEGNLIVPFGKNVFFGILIAIGIGFGGYLKNTKPEEFDPIKFFITVIIGVFTGIAMWKLGLDYTAANTFVVTWLSSTGALAWIETYLKVFIRQLGVFT